MKHREKVGFVENIKLLIYGAKLTGKLTPAFWPSMLLGQLITAGQPMAVLYFSARILGELAGGRDVQTVVVYAVITVALTFTLSALKTWLDYIATPGNDWFYIAFERIQMMEAERFASMDYSHTEDTSVSETLARMDTFARGNALGLIGMYYNCQAIAGSAFSMLFSLLLLTNVPDLGGGGIVIWAAFAVLFGGMLLYQRKQKSMHETIITTNAGANTAADFYNGYIGVDAAAKDIRLYSQQPAVNKLFREAFNAETWSSFFHFLGRSAGFSSAALAALGGLIYYFVGNTALQGGADVGAIVQSVGAVTALATAFGMLFSQLGRLYSDAAYIAPMRDYMELPDVLTKGTLPVPNREDGAYEIEFRNVSFRYPTAEGYAIENLNLKLNTGKRLAVVGLNGSGKTTMIKLLCRLYQPTEGEILLDGVNINEYDYIQYIALFSVVFQDYLLFPLGLAHNVAAGESYDERRVRDCLNGAGFSERLASMPEGLDTMLYRAFDEDGVQLSGGEAQKLALARALYKNAPIVVLDEPTAALDPMAEFEVYTTFDRTIGERTAVFISHRLSSCRFCSDIAVFDAGRMVQRGDHDTLLVDESGRYAELWAAQSQYYVEE